MVERDQEEPEFCEVHLLSDTPSDVDEFGSHGRVAISLAETILSNSGGKAIALTGAYGSGKSTVVRLLIEKLDEDNSPATVFSFDSWVHQADPLRRSFLESLIRHLADKGWLSGDIKKRELATLAGGEERSTTVSEPSLTLSGKLLAPTSLLLPIGYLLISSSLTDKTKLPSTIWLFPSLWLGVVLALTPVIVALIIYLAWRPNLRILTGDFWAKHRHPHEDDSVLNLFLQKTRETTTSTTIRTPELTTIEFEAMFGRLLNATLTGSERTLILVIDNLDRLPSDQAQTVWSTMRIFTEGQSAGGAPWHERVWLLVPIETTSLGHVWPQLSEKTEQQSIFDKTFAVSVSVPPPVLSDWQAFLRSELVLALPQHRPVESFEDVVRLYGRYIFRTDQPAYPREVKLFVNRLATLHHQRGRDICLPLVAAFVLHSDQIKAASRDLTTVGLLDPQELSILNDEEWANKFAALYYGVEVAKGLQVLMGSRVQAGLEEGNMDVLMELSQIPGFTAVCQQVVDTQRGSWSPSEAAPLLHATASIVQLERSINGLGPAKNTLIDACGKAAPWSVNNDLAGLMIEIVDASPAAQRANIFLHFVNNVAVFDVPDLSDPATIAPPTGSINTVPDWSDGFLRLLYAARVFVTDEERSQLWIGGTPNFYLAVLRAFTAQHDLGGGIGGCCRPNGATPEAVIALLAERVANKSLDVHDADVMRFMLTIPEAWQWAPFATAAASALIDFGQAAPVPSSLILTLLRLSALGVPEARTTLHDAAAQGGVLHQLYLAQTVGDATEVGLLLLASLLHLSSGDVPSLNGQAANGQAFNKAALQSPATVAASVQALIAVGPLTGLAGDLLDVLSANPPVAGIASEFLSVLLTSAEAPGLPADVAVARFGSLSGALTPDQLHLVLSKVSADQLFERFAADGFLPSSADLYRGALLAHPDPPPTFAQFAIQGLSSLTSADWESDLIGTATLIGIGSTLVATGSTVELGEALQEAILATLRRVLSDGQLVPTVPAAMWLLRPTSLKTLMRNVTDDLVARPDEHIEALISLVGDRLLASGALAEAADGFVRRVGIAIIDSGTHDGLLWLEDAFATERGILSSAEGETLESISEHLQARLDSFPTDATERAPFERLQILLAEASAQR